MRKRLLENGQTVEWAPRPWTAEKQAEIDALTILLARRPPELPTVDAPPHQVPARTL